MSCRRFGPRGPGGRKFDEVVTKRPPLEARARLEANIKRVADNRSLSYAQRYHYNMLVSRFTSYRELWRRNLKARGEEL